MKNQKRQKFSEDFKKEVCLAVIGGKLSREAARRFYGIKGNSAVTNWIRNYESDKFVATAIDVNLPTMTQHERDKFEELKRKIAFLEEQLFNETHRAGLYKKMIEIAEDELNIPIRKKYGAKQLKNTKSKHKE